MLIIVKNILLYLFLKQSIKLYRVNLSNFKNVKLTGQNDFKKTIKGRSLVSQQPCYSMKNIILTKNKHNTIKCHSSAHLNHSTGLYCKLPFL